MRLWCVPLGIELADVSASMFLRLKTDTAECAKWGNRTTMNDADCGGSRQVTTCLRFEYDVRCIVTPPRNLFEE
jgi:hypothetical protein